MQLRSSMRRTAQMRLALAGTSGSGKTYSSLLFAYGMTSDWPRVAVIDSENGSADLYAHLGNYQVLALPDYSPETYIKAIGICKQAGLKSSASAASPIAGIICSISMPTCKETPLPTRTRSHPVRMPPSNAFSIPRVTSSVPCAPSRIIFSRTRTARWGPKRWTWRLYRAITWTMSSLPCWTSPWTTRPLPQVRTGLIAGRSEFTITPAVGKPSSNGAT